MNYHVECNLLHFQATCPKKLFIFFFFLYQFISCAACLIIWLYSLWIHIGKFSHKCHFCLATYITTSEMSLLLHKGRRKNFWLKFWLLCYTKKGIEWNQHMCFLTSKNLRSENDGKKTLKNFAQNSCQNFFYSKNPFYSWK